MTLARSVVPMLMALAIAGCAAAGGAPMTKAGRGAGGATTPRAAPEIGASTSGDRLQIAYEPPHLRFSMREPPEGAISVIYAVASTRDKKDQLQIDSVAPDASFPGMLEYDRLAKGEYTVTAFAKGVAEPLDARTIMVPD